MNPLLKRLAWLRRRLVLWTGARGLFAVLGLILGAGFLAGLLDWFFLLPGLVRAYSLAGILVGASVIAYTLLLRQILAPKDDLALALQVEAAYPELNDVLGSTVQFLSLPPGSPSAGSTQMRDMAVHQAMQLSEGRDFGTILDRRGALLAGLGFAAAALLVGFFFFKYPLYAFIATQRLADPFGHHTWTRIEIAVPDKVEVRKELKYQARLTGVIPENAEIQIRTRGKEDIKKPKVSMDGKTGHFEIQLPLVQEVGKLEFRVLAGDGSFPPVPGAWHQLDLVEPPGLVQLTATLEFPSYTGQPPFSRTSVRNLIQLSHEHFVPGSVVRLQGDTDRPIRAGYLEVHPREGVAPAAEKPKVKARGKVKEKPEDKEEAAKKSKWEKKKLGELGAAVTALVGAPAGLEALPLAVGAQGPASRFPPQLIRFPLPFLGDDRRRFDISFEAWFPGDYYLRLEDEDGFTQDLKEVLGVKVDELPDVRLVLTGLAGTLVHPRKDGGGPEGGKRPRARGPGPYALKVVPDVRLSGLLTAQEKDYFLRSAFVELVPVDDKDRPVGPPLPILVRDLEDLGRTVSVALAGPASALAGPGFDHAVRFQSVFDLPVDLALANRFKPGQVLLVRGCGQDNCDVFLDREPGRSDDDPSRAEPIRLMVLAKESLYKAEEEMLSWSRDRVGKAREDLDKAAVLVRELQKEKEVKIKEDFRLISARNLHDDVKSTLEDLLDRVQEQVALREINRLPSRRSGEILQKLKKNLEKLIDVELRDLKDATDRVAEEKAKIEVKPEVKPEGKPKGKPEGKKEEVRHMDHLVLLLILVGGGKEEAGPKAGPEPKAGPAPAPRATSLELVGKLQAKTGNKLKDISDLLEPFHSLKSIREKALEILAKQEDLHAAAEKIEKDWSDFDRADLLPEKREDRDREIREEQTRRGEAQTTLGNEAEELLNEIREEADRQAALGDDAAAGRLKKAHAIGTGGEAPLVSEMRAVGGELRKVRLPRERPPWLHITQRMDNIEGILRKLIKALDERKATEDMDRLAKKRDTAVKNVEMVEGFRKELDELRGRRVKAAGLKDKMEWEKEMEAIRKDEEALKKRMEAFSRELARLEEPGAAKAIADAAKELGKEADKEGDKMKEGDLDKAIERVADAGKELEKTREELDREQLAQIADLIKGLKERQDDLIERGDELHKKVMDRKIWSEGQRDTLEKSALAQKGLSSEVAGLSEKLKDAIVFGHIMTKAGKFMERAAEELTARHQASEMRAMDAMAQEELADEERRHGDIKRYQSMASKRLERLLEAVKDAKPALAKKDAPKKDKEKKEGAKDEPKVDGGGGGGGPGDSIPPVAQLKALKEEQIDIRERTKDFDGRFPDRKDLTPEAMRELLEIQEDQLRVHELFERMTVPADKKGARP